jgi:hypothetical protein
MGSCEDLRGSLVAINISLWLLLIVYVVNIGLKWTLTVMRMKNPHRKSMFAGYERVRKHEQGLMDDLDVDEPIRG